MPGPGSRGFIQKLPISWCPPGRHLTTLLLRSPLYLGCVIWAGATLGHETVWRNRRRAGGVAELEVYVHDH